MTDLSTMVVRLEAETSKYQTQLASATKQLQKFQTDTTNSVKDIAHTVVEVLAVRELAEFASRVIENTAHLDEFAKSTGIAVDELSKLQYAGKLEGVDDLDTALGKLSKSAAGAVEGNKDLQGAFAALGVSVTDANGKLKPTDQILLAVADGFAKYADGAAKSALAQQLFGRGGAQLIAFLDQGSAAIRAQGDELAQLGGVVTPAAAAAAKEFEDNQIRLNAAMTGFAQQALAAALPKLVELTDRMVDSAKSAHDFADVADQVNTGLKLLASGAVIVGTVFEVVGKAIATQASAIAGYVSHIDLSLSDLALGPQGLAMKLGSQIAQGVKQGGAAIDAGMTDIVGTVKSSVDALGKIWSGADDQLEAIAVTAHKIKPDLVLIDTKAQDSAIQKLTQMKETLDQQVATFGLGQAAAIKYELTLGKLSDEVEHAGAKGKILRDEIEKQAAALEGLRNVNALKNIDAQMESLAGHTAQAAAEQFDLANATLKASLAAMPNHEGDAGLEKLANQKALIVAQEQYNELQVAAQRIEADEASREADINRLVASGQETTLKGQADIAQARADEVAQLGSIYTAMKAISDQNAEALPALTDKTKQLSDRLKDVAASTHQVADKLRTDFVDGAADAWTSFVTGEKSAHDALLDFVHSFESEIIKLASKNLLEGLFPSGGGSSIFTALAGLLGGGSSLAATNFAGAGSQSALTALEGVGGLAGGGHMEAGQRATVGEFGAEEWIPDTSGTIVPNSKVGKGDTHIHFTINAPSGTITRATQSQIAGAAATGIGRANRRQL